MLSRSERLNRTQFSKFFASGRRIHTPNLTLVYSPLTSFLSSVVVGKKVAKLAHERNKIRRRVYVALREVKKSLDLKGALIVITKPSIKGVSKKDFIKTIAEEIGLALNKR